MTARFGCTVYYGPMAVWRRFKAGMLVTHDNYIEDDSLWFVEPTTRYDLARFGAML